MAIHFAARWRPQIYRSTTEAIIVNRHPASPDADPPIPASAGQRIEVLQLVCFDDAEVGTPDNPYRPGDPQTEQYLAICDEAVIQLDVSAFAGKTPAQARALWDAARDARIAAWQAQPDIGALVMAALGAYLSPYEVVQ